jgi:iron complex transport system substrate-binding protein
MSRASARPSGLRRATSLALVVLISLSVLGCGEEPPLPEPPAPERIITVAPSLTEVVFALGLGDRVVGVGNHAQWPPEVLSKPRVGGLFDVYLEQIVELDPDLAILLPSEERLQAQMQELGVEVMTVEHETLFDVETSMLQIAERMGVTERGVELAEGFRRDLEPDPLPANHPVLLSVTRDAGNLGEVLVAGPGTFYDELLIRLGVINALAGSDLPYPQISAEQVLRRAPHAIIELQPQMLSSVGEQRLLSDWQQFEELPAARSGCLRVVAGDHTLLPGPRVTRLYRELREALASCPAYAE